MFGYVLVNKEKLSEEDYKIYRGYYCGLCRTLGKKYGTAGQLTLSYDMTFLYLLLSGLYEPNEEIHVCRCKTHPLKKHEEIINPYADYAADMNILLSYYNFMDDYKDSGNKKSKLAARKLEAFLPDIKSRYPRQTGAVETYVEDLIKAQEENCPETDRELNIDEMAGLTGRMLAEVFCMKEDEWSGKMRQLGFFLGKYIYLLDAFDDIEEDVKSGSFNVWGDKPEPEKTEKVLSLMMSECAFAFEAMPILKNAEIIRNVLYSGVWTKFVQVLRRRNDDRSLQSVGN